MAQFSITQYIEAASHLFPDITKYPWEIINSVEALIHEKISQLDPDEYDIQGEVAIHKTATVEQNVIFKGPILINKNSQIAANCYFRAGVYLGENVHIGPSCEIKSSIIFSNTAIAHLNYVGNSIIGSKVNMEGGSVLANHFNEREDKEIHVVINNEVISTKAIKFGALVGDNSRIGANAVTTPGTILKPKSIVARLELVDQVSNYHH